jgi:Integrase core domain
MHVQPHSTHNSPFVDNERERGGTHDKDGFVLSAHRDKSQGRPRTTPSSQLIGYDGLPVRVSQPWPHIPGTTASRQGRTTFSSPDNGSPYVSIAHAAACRLLGIRHLRTRPYRPQTNGKAERFIRTLLVGWAYGAIYRTSSERTRALDGWLWHYNHQRRHSALNHKTPIAHLNERTNQPSTYS